MLQYLGILLKRPSDKNIKILKIVFGVLLILTSFLVFGIEKLEIQNSLFGYNLNETTKLIIRISIVILGFFPVILGGLDLHILSRGRTRILQIMYGILLIFIGSLFVENATLGGNIFYTLLGIIAIISGISGKLITQKGLKHGQKITKIRV